MINYYRQISPFFLNIDAKKLINAINESKQTNFVIEANRYGAYICLAALYSGELYENKKIQFILEEVPLALFPTILMKSIPKDRFHKIIFRLSEECWLSPFSSLYSNQKIKYSLTKKQIKKAA